MITLHVAALYGNLSTTARELDQEAVMEYLRGAELTFSKSLHLVA